MKNSGATGQSFGTSSNSRHTFTVTKDCKVAIHRGDISKANVQAIVCTENTSFAGVGVLAEAIAKAGGTSYVKEKEKLKKDLPMVVKEGTVLVTKAGKLQCSKVLHFILPTRMHEANLRSGIEKILNMATEEIVRTLALPAIGMGHSGILKDTGCQVIADTICIYLRTRGSSISEIQLIDKDASRIESLWFEFTRQQSRGDISGVHYKAENPQRRLYSEVSASQQSRTGEQDRGEPQASGSSDITSTFQYGAGRPKSHFCSHTSGHTNFYPVKGGTKGHMVCSVCIIPGKPGVCRSCEHGDPVVHPSPNEQDKDKKKGDDCCICLSSITDPKSLLCGHAFCKGCIDEYFSHGSKLCPICKKVCGKMTGNQPVGRMDVAESGSQYPSCPGYEGYGTFTITYSFNSGIQRPGHPNPGKSYKGTHRIAYLPASREGWKVQKLLRRAFDQGLLFTIGTSVTTGKTDVVTWNDIHHKTSMYGGPEKFGYPDPTYLVRVQEELKAKGITDDNADVGKSESTV